MRVCVYQDLGTPTEKIWEGLKDLPVWKKTSFEVHETNKLRDRFTSIFTDMGFDLINKSVVTLVLGVVVSTMLGLSVM